MHGGFLPHLRENCKDGLEQFCASGATFTYNAPDKISGGMTGGGYSDSIVVDEAFVLKVPKHLDLAASAPLLCAGITTYSPLRHYKVGKGHPIAGTRPRHEDSVRDVQLETELRADAKENAEHVMLVDLARNDLGRVARAGSVRVEPYRSIERYSHVMHIVSGVSGQLAAARCLRSVRGHFPAGTLVGAPKVRAMEIIEELEPVRRGLYGGTVGYSVRTVRWTRP